MPTPYTKALVALTGAALLWGFNPFMNKVLLSDGTPVTFICLRFLLSSLTIFAFLLITGKLHFPRWRDLPVLALLGLLSVSLNNTVAFEALKYSTVTNCALINTLSPLLTALLAAIFLRERMLNIQWTGILLALFSTIFILRQGNLLQFSWLSLNRGDVYFLFSQLSWAAYTLISVPVLRRMPLLDMVAWSGLLGVCINAAYGYGSGELQLPNFTVRSLSALSYIIWGSAMSAMILWNFGVRYAGPSKASIFINLSTLISIISGIVFLKEPLTYVHILGGGGIIFGMFVLTQPDLSTRIYHTWKHHLFR